MDMLTDEYRLLRRLGRGGMGEVWEAARIKENHVVVPCAIKLLHADFTETARERKLFLDEARIATQLDHSRIVKVIDVGTTADGQPFLVMERVDGIDLRSFLKEAEKEALTPLDIDIVVYIVGEVLAALDYAHERTIGGADAGIIHSDVTPGNIMISSSGEVKLTDFGIARFAATAGPMSRAIGTPRYMSPEQLSGRPRRETDIYGLGVVLHEMLDGDRFLDGCTPDEFRSRVLMGPPPELERSDVPAWLDDLRRRMIATDYRDRPRASEARALMIEHCPRYLVAGEQLKTNYYARLIGRRRSGVTQLLRRADEAAMPNLIPQIGQQAADSGPLGLGRAHEGYETVADSDDDDDDDDDRDESPSAGPVEVTREPARRAAVAGQAQSATYTAADRAGRLHLAEPSSLAAPIEAQLPPEYGEVEDEDDPPLERTELLAPVGLSEDDGETERSGDTTPAVAGLPPPEREAGPGRARLRGLAIASAVAAVVLAFTVVVLLVQMFGKGGDEAAVAGDEAGAESGTETGQATVVVPDLGGGGETETGEATGTQTETGDGETGDGDSDGETGDGDGDGGLEGDGDGDDIEKPEPEPEPEPEPKPKPKPVVVLVIVEGKIDGKVKIGGYTKDTRNRSTFFKLRPGSYKVRWQPAGTKTWTDSGKLRVEDIAPKQYQVNLGGGKLEVKELQR